VAAFIKSGLIGGLLLASATPTGALAQTTAASADSHNLRCLIAAATVAENPDPNVKTIGLMAGMYYAGAVFAADPDIDLKVALKREALAMKAGDLASIAASCGAEMQARGKQLTDAGQALKDVKIPATPPPEKAS
jgi:hypothetical protein